MNKNRFNVVVAAIASVLMFSGCGETTAPAQTAENDPVSNSSGKTDDERKIPKQLR